MRKAADEFAKELIVALKKERTARNISHEKLAELAGISRQAVGKIEAGDRTPSIKNVFKLVRAMDMTLSDFIQKVEKSAN